MMFWQFAIDNCFCCSILELRTLRPKQAKYIPKLPLLIGGRVEMQTQLCVASEVMI